MKRQTDPSARRWRSKQKNKTKNVFLFSSNNSRPSINRLPPIIAPPTPLAPSSLSFISSLSRWSAMRFSKSDQWRFGLWKLIEELNLFSFFDMLIFFLFHGKIKQNIKPHHFPSNIWNNRLPRIIAFPRIVAPFLCEKRNTVNKQIVQSCFGKPSLVAKRKMKI